MTQQDLKALSKVAARAAASLILSAAVVGVAGAEEASRADVLQRIKPVGSVAVTPAAAPAAPVPAPTAAPVAAAETPATVPAATAAAPAAGAIDGQAVYSKACFACHGTGVAGAPKLGDKAAWAPRIAQGRETLLGHAVNGFQGQAGVMPPKGGATYLSDDEVSAAIDYMVSQAE